MFGTTDSLAKVIEKSNKLLEKGKPEKAIQVFEGPLKRAPGNFDLILGLGEVYCRLQDTQAALREYRKAFKSNPGKAREILGVLEAPQEGVKIKDFCELRIEILIHLRNLDGAMGVIEKTDESTLSKILERAGNRMAELRKISPEGENALLMAELGYHMGLIHEFKQSFGSAFAVYTTILKVREEEFLRLFSRLEGVVKKIQDDAGPHLYMGEWLRTQKPEKSAGYYENAMKINPRSASAIVEQFQGSVRDAWERWLLGKAYLLTEEWSEGTECLKELKDEVFRSPMIQLLQGFEPSKPGTEPVLLFLGDLQRDSGNFNDASKTYAVLSGRVHADVLRERFQDLIKLDPENICAARTLGEICLGQGDLVSSIAQMRKLLQADPSQADILFEKAFPILKENFGNTELPLFLAELCLNHPEAERPLVLLRRFVQLAPEDAGRALPFYQELIQKNSTNAQLRVGEAEVLLALGKAKEALQRYRLALSLDPGVLHDVLHDLSLLLRESPALSSDIQELFIELESKGVLNPAVSLVWAEALMASGAFQEAVDRSIRCVLEVPEEMLVVEDLLREWGEAHLDRIEFPLGLAQLYSRTERFHEVAETLEKYIGDHPGAAEKAVAFYRQLLQEHPENLTLYQGMLATYLQSGAFDLALKEGKRLEKTFRVPQIGRIHRIMGDACKEMGHFTNAVSWHYQAYKEDPTLAESIAQRLQEILFINPSLAKASLALGTVLSFCGRVAEGVEHLLCLTRDLPNSRETVMKYLKHISAKHPMQIEPILGMAELYIDSETYEPALELLWKATQRETLNTDAILRLLDRLAEKNPGMARVQLEMGKVYLKVGYYARASEHLVSAVEADPSISEQGIKFCHDIIAAEPGEIAAYEAIGRIFVRMKRHAAAVTFLSSSSDTRPEIRAPLLSRMEEIAEMVPNNGEVLRVLAWNYLKSGKIDASVHPMERALALDPASAKQGEAFFSEIIKQCSGHTEARMARGRCRLKIINLQGAFEDIRLAVQSAPEKIDKGIELLEALKQKGLNRVELYLFLGELFLHKEKFEAAIGVLQEGLQSLNEVRDRMQLIIRLAENYERIGDTAAAQKGLDEAKSLSEDHDFYYQKLNEFAVQRILFDTRRLEQKAGSEQILPVEELKRLVKHLVLFGRETEAEDWVRKQVRSRSPEETREVWGHFQEETGNYALAVQLKVPADPYRQAYLLERAGEPLLAASMLEEAVREEPDPILYNHLKASCATLMEEFLLKEKRPLMGETRLKISVLS